MRTTAADPLTALIRRYLATGDAAAMEEVVARTRPRLLRVAGRICRSGEAEDAVQAAYHALLRRGDLPGGAPPLGWLVTTTVRIAWRLNARGRRFDTIARRLDVPEDRPGPAQGAARSEEIRRLVAEVARLPAKYRDPVVLHHLKGVPVADLARLMEVPEGTVKTRLRRGRRLLEGRLAPLTAGALILGWALVDLVHPAAAIAAPATGGAMKAKTVIGIGLIALVSGVTGFAIGAAPANGNTAPTAPDRPALERASTPAAPDPANETAPDAAPAEPPAAPEAPPTTEAWEKKIREEAERLGVTEPALRAACHALAASNGLLMARRSNNAWEDHHLAEVQDAVDELAEMGEEGFLAMLALSRCSYSRAMGDLLVRLCPPGGETRLVRDATDSSRLAMLRLSAVNALAEIRTPEVDAALTDLLGRTDDPVIFTAALDALAPRKVEIDLARVETALREPKWMNRQPAILEALARAGGDGSAALLSRLARDPEFPRPGPALAALAAIDPARAKAEAAALLDGPRGADLPAMQRARLRVVSGRW